jgi:hypothetical protein
MRPLSDFYGFFSVTNLQPVRNVRLTKHFILIAVWLIAVAISFPQAEADGPLQIWQAKERFFVVIAIDQTGVKGTELPFASVDARRVASALQGLGYQPLIKGEPVLTDPRQGRVVEAVQEIRELPETATVVIYYSGHGVVDPQEKDVWLQLAGQSKVTDHLGVSVSQLIENARGSSYKGELHIIVDACFSGRGAYTGNLTLKEFGSNTTVLTSSSETQNSYALRLDDGTELSAFTYALAEAWGPEWSRADDNGDGVLSFQEIFSYSVMRLQQLYQDKTIKQKMQPQLIGSHDDAIFIAYKADKVKNRCSISRTVLTALRMEMIIKDAQSQPIAAQAQPGKPEMPPEAQALAKSLCDEGDPIIRALKSRVEGPKDEKDALIKAFMAELRKELTQEFLRGNDKSSNAAPPTTAPLPDPNMATMCGTNYGTCPLQGVPAGGSCYCRAYNGFTAYGTAR